MSKKGDDMTGLQLLVAMGKMLVRQLHKLPNGHPLLWTICILLVIVALGTQVTYADGALEVEYRSMLG